MPTNQFSRNATLLALLLCAAATFFLTGLIWFVQVVHYPLFAQVTPENFPAYHAEHTTLTTWLVAVPMVVELLTSIWLTLLLRNDTRLRTLARTGLVFVVIVWGSTAWIQVPQHQRLSRGFEPAVHAALVRGNWIRVGAWSSHACVILIMLACVVAAGSGRLAGDMSSAHPSVLHRPTSGRSPGP